MIRASLEKDPKDVATMFDDVAKRYDVTNDVLSLGQDRLWRKAVVRAVDAQVGERVLDIAAGTATLWETCWIASIGVPGTVGAYGGRVSTDGVLARAGLNFKFGTF